MEYFWKCAVSFIAGGIFGIVIMALMVTAKQADKHLESEDDPAECFWCGDRIAKFPGGRFICQGCGWEYKKESQAATESKEK